MYNANNFIVPLGPNDYIIVLKTDDDVIRYSIDPNTITAIGRQDNKVIIKINTDSKVIGLDLIDIAAARIAVNALQNAVDTAKSVRSIQINQAATERTTAADFLTVAADENLVPYTWYQVEDTSDVFGLGLGNTISISSTTSNGNDYLGVNNTTGELLRIRLDPPTVLPLDGTLVHTQTIPDNIWTIQHLYNKLPSVVVTDLTGTNNLKPTIKYLGTDTVQLIFDRLMTGIAYLN